MLEFLSDEWLAALAARLRQGPGTAGSARFALGQVVTDVPSRGGDPIAYTLLLGGGVPAEVVPETVELATVTLVTAYADAARLAGGECTAAELLETGRIRVRGNAAALVAAASLIENVAAATAGLQAATRPG